MGGGCIAGFFNLFDRNHVISRKHLPPFTAVVDSESGSASTIGSPAVSREFDRSKLRQSPPPAHDSPVKKSPSKLRRELPRLSLDSRLHPRGKLDDEYDESDTQRRSPSVVARLMGLEPLNGLPEKKSELRRSCSESRTIDLLHCRFVDANISPAKREKEPRRMIAPQRERKGVYDYGDFFPEAKKPLPSLPSPTVTVSSVYGGGVEKRLRKRGIHEPDKDLETLKQILESLQLKGLLHHHRNHADSAAETAKQIGRRNFVYERRFPYDESPIVVMKPARSPRRIVSEPSPPRFVPRRNLSVNVTGGEAFSPRSARSPTRNLNQNQNPSSPGRRKAGMEAAEGRRVSSPVQSPRMGGRRVDRTASLSPRRRKSTAEIRLGRTEDELSSTSTVSESNSTEKSKREESYKDEKSLLERCNKLLNTIAEMNSAANNSTELQQSPVSVLDSSLYKEEESPSPVKKRAIDLKELEDEIWSSSSSGEAFLLKSDDDVDSQRDPDFTYVSEIIRASNHLPDDTDIFSLLEKHQSIKGRDTSKSSRLQRRLIFDTITEILDRDRQLPLWKSTPYEPQLSAIWSELQRIQKRDESEDMFEVICGVMKRDMTRDSTNGWGGECTSELSEAVLDIERLIFKDLIGETIRDLTGFSGRCSAVSASRRKLMF